MSSQHRYVKENLQFMGIDLNSLAQKHGTPLFVYSKERIRENNKALKGAFEGPVSIHFAMKSNSNKLVLKFINSLGLNADVVSLGEIQRARACGFKPKQIIFAGVGKRVDEITAALKIGIKFFNVESPQELERIGTLAKQLKKKASVAFRINPQVNSKTHPYITTGEATNKFGMEKSVLPRLKEILTKFSPWLDLVGVSFHVGSQIMDLQVFEEAILKTVPIYRDLLTQGYNLKYFDVGGGIGISYTGGKALDILSYGRKVEKLIKPLGAEIIIEPGRSLVGDAGVLLTRVEYIKKTSQKTFVIVDTGMHQLIRPCLYNAFHRIIPVRQSTKVPIKTDVVGPICETSDFLGRDVNLPEPLPGDFLAICDTGAYGFVMSSDYNLQPKAKEILV